MPKAPDLKSIAAGAEESLAQIAALGPITGKNHAQYKTLVAQALSLSMQVSYKTQEFIQAVSAESATAHAATLPAARRTTAAKVVKK